MKFIKNHLTFIFPMMAILLGVEFFLVFDRTTSNYEKDLREGYSMFIVALQPITLDEFEELDSHISQSEEVKKEELAKQIAKGMSKSSSKKILEALPHFYNIKFDRYLHTSKLEHIKAYLEADERIKKVETFGTSYGASYTLFSFIKFTFKAFVIFMSLVSLFLVTKQMEIWNYAHKERMQVMETFGAPLMLRSGVLFKVAFIDAMISTILTTGIFLFVKHKWAEESHIEILMKMQNSLFQPLDFFILLSASILIVFVSVYLVVFSSKG